MPRNRGGTKQYQDDMDDVAGAYDDAADDGYDARAHPSSKHVRNMRAEQETVREVKIPREKHSVIIGRGGATLRELEATHGVKIDVPPRNVKDDTVYVEGLESAAQAAVDAIHQKINEAALLSSTKNARPQGKKGGSAPSAVTANTGGNEQAFPALPGQETVAVSVDVEKFAHGLVIGTGGQRVQDLRRRLARKDGVPLVRETAGIDVIVPDKADTSTIITVHVPKHTVDHAVAQIKDFFNFYEISHHLQGITVAGSSVGSALAADASTRGAKASRNKDAQPTPARAAAPAAAAAAGAKPAAGAALSAPAAPAAETAPVAASKGRGARQPACAFVDLVQLNGYTHEALPQRTW